MVKNPDSEYKKGHKDAVPAGTVFAVPDGAGAAPRDHPENAANKSFADNKIQTRQWFDFTAFFARFRDIIGGLKSWQ
jgi:hypothetical protein